MNNDISHYTKLAFVYFGLSLPLSDSGLKKAFRRESLRLHPDKGGNSEQFIKMNDAYKALSSAIGVIPDVSKSYVVLDRTKTVEGFPLSELGLGLGPTVNGKNCSDCDHKGYRTRHGSSYQVCAFCTDGWTYVDGWCRDCGGTGKFKQQRSLRIVECRKCKGTRVFRSTRRILCLVCFGTATIWKDDETEHYVKCSTCRGT